MAKLSLQHIYKIYDNGTKAVNDFNLEIGDNEFVVFVGPSGCGKSTTLRMIAGLEDITAGDFYIDGQLANQLEPKDRDMAMVFQNYALYPHMTVFENMAFGLRIRHIPKEEIRQRVNEAAQILDIANQLDKKPKAMSGGQRQRVALGRAIVRKPKVFLLDEPLSNLDAKLRSSMRSEIIRLHNVLKTTFIYVTHDQIEAMTMGSKIVVMRDGVIQQVDTPMNLYDYPSNMFVAGFIGTPQMNFLNGELSYNDKGEICLKIGESIITCPKGTFEKLDILNIHQKKMVKIGIRPEHLFLSKDSKNCLTGTINIVEALGNDSNIIAETSDGSRIVLKILRNDALMVGNQINIGFDFSKIHLFDVETEATMLPRIPTHFTVKGKASKGSLSLLGGKLALGGYLSEALKDANECFVSINSESFKEGKDFSLPIVDKQQINGKWLNTLKHEEETLYVYTDEYIYGETYEFSLKQEELTIYSNDLTLLVEPIQKENAIDGKLVPIKRMMTSHKGTLITEEEGQRRVEEAKAKGEKEPSLKKKNVKLFNYSLLGHEYVPSEEDILKIYSLLGKKFYLHDIRFYVDSQDIRFADEGVQAKITKVIDYQTSKYYLVDILVGEAETQQLYVVGDEQERKVGDIVHLDIKGEDIGVYDVNFGVKLS